MGCRIEKELNAPKRSALFRFSPDREFLKAKQKTLFFLSLRSGLSALDQRSTIMLPRLRQPPLR